MTVNGRYQHKRFVKVVINQDNASVRVCAQQKAITKLGRQKHSNTVS